MRKLSPRAGALCYLLRKKRGLPWATIEHLVHCSNSFQVAMGHAKKNNLPWPVKYEGIRWAKNTNKK